MADSPDDCWLGGALAEGLSGADDEIGEEGGVVTAWIPTVGGQ
jgi:hypothetical protein